MLNIDRVINYELPESGELFVHRVGRTGRMGRWGQAITIIAATDLQKMQEIERYLHKKLPRVPISQLETLAPKDTQRAPIIDDDDEVVPVAASHETAAPAKRRRRRVKRPDAVPVAVAQPLTQGVPA
jgi:superfamily II DNA/RNA helicase